MKRLLRVMHAITGHPRRCLRIVGPGLERRCSCGFHIPGNLGEWAAGGSDTTEGSEERAES